MTRTEIRQKANSEMEKRRLRAEAEAEARTAEIYKKLPQVAEIRRMLAGTASELSQLIIRRGNNYKESFEKIKQSNLEGSRMIKSILRSNGYPEDYLEVHYRCSACNDTGYTDMGMCDCMKRLINKIASEELNRSANMPDADFAHFSLDYYRGITVDGVDCYAKMADNLDFCIKYANGFSHNSKSILMLGKTGVGKTHLSMSIAKEVIKGGSSVIYGSVLNLLREIEKEHFGRAEGDSDTLSALCGCDLLIMDDLGAEPRTPFYESAVYNLINSRMNMGLPTIVSSNYSVEELYEHYNERIISRLFGFYEVLIFVGKDIRQLKRLEK